MPGGPDMQITLDARGQLRLLAVMLAVAIVEYGLGANGHMLPAIYVSPAMLLAGLFAVPRRDMPSFACAGLLIQFAALAGAGMQEMAAAETALCLALQAGLGALFLRHRLPGGLDLTRLRPILDLTITAMIVAPPLGFAGEMAFAHLDLHRFAGLPEPRPWFPHHPRALSLIGWILPQALGIVLVVPVVTAAIHRGMARPLAWFTRDRSVMFGGLTVMTAAVFSRNDPYSLVLLAPALVAIAIRFGIRDTTLAIVATLLIAAAATANNIGALAAITDDPLRQTAMLRAFFLIAFITVLPVAATLERMRRLERSLDRNTRFTDQVLRNMREVVFRTDTEGRWSFLNPAWLDVTGYSVSESLGQMFTALVPVAEQGDLKAALTRLTAGAVQSLDLALNLRRRDGELREFEVTVRLLREADGSIAGSGGIIRDVTEMRRHLRALESSERRFRDLCDSAPVGILRTDIMGAITYVNWMFELTALAEQGQLIGCGLAAWLAGAEGLGAGELALALSVPSARIEREVELRDATGKPRWLTVVIASDLDADGEKLGYVGVVAEITSRKLAEIELIDARQRAEQGTAAKSAFLANISHEIRTPMNGVIGLTELLLEGQLDRTSRNYARLIAESGATMMQLLNDVLDLAKIEAGRFQLVDEVVDLGAVLTGSLAMMTGVATRKGLSVSLDIDPALPPLMRGDQQRLRQMLANLIGNAVKFTEAGEVVVGAVAEGETLVLTVRDTGIGIPLDAQAAVFEEFVQGARSCSSSGASSTGTGLGLPITRQLASAMGGTLGLDSTPGVGTTMTLRLPVSFVADRREAPREVAIPSDAGATALYLLVAEDNRTNQIIARGMLERLGHSVTIAGNGLEALAAVEKAAELGHQFDMVLMDVFMPEMDGLAAARALRAAGHSARDLPIVAVTANAFAEDIENCFAAGMQGHIAKPLQIADLSDALASLAAARADQAAGVNLPAERRQAGRWAVKAA